jgi:hypothetical protein
MNDENRNKHQLYLLFLEEDELIIIIISIVVIALLVPNRVSMNL